MRFYDMELTPKIVARYLRASSEYIPEPDECENCLFCAYCGAGEFCWKDKPVIVVDSRGKQWIPDTYQPERTYRRATPSNRKEYNHEYYMYRKAQKELDTIRNTQQD